ncbi:hypothetical protein NJB93_20775 [Brucella intermedia]|uniref:hypothetical protein n=1 Tax=Brucella intermedia TaxID=94625 RepID=UPI00209B2B99|nr:hypothetical protein [Brucella intermedia]MCO7728998.1 hypothetical protein [Brucella intermedia]
MGIIRKRSPSKIGRFWALTPAQTWQMRAQIVAFAGALYLLFRPATLTEFLWPCAVLLLAFYLVSRFLWKLYATHKNGKLAKLMAYESMKRASQAARQQRESTPPGNTRG